MATVPTVGSTGSTTTETLPPTVPSGGQTLTQADFLKIMVAQFTQQDPLSSGDGSSGGSGTSDYVNQLMSMTNLTTLQTESGEQAQQLAASLPGDTVVVQDSTGDQISGTVQSARVNGSDGGVYFTVNGTEYPSSELYSITQNASQTATAPTTPVTTPTTPTTN